MRILLISLLVLYSASAFATEDHYDFNDPLQFVVYVLEDDVVRGAMKFNRTSGLDGFAGVTLNTPTIDGLAAAGFVHQGFHSYPLCTFTRQAHADIGGYRTPNHSSAIIHPNSDGSLDPNWYVPTLWRQFGDIGFRSFFVGKWHMNSDWNCHGTHTETAMQAAGIDEAPSVSLGNPLEQTDCYDVNTDPLGCWANCRGHKCWPTTTLEGVTALTETHSSKYFYDFAVAYIQEKIAAATLFEGVYINGGKHFLTIWTSAPHVPFRSGDDVLVCEGNTADQNDWPPGSAQVGDKNDVYLELVAYNDSRLGDIKALLDVTRDIILTTSDNGDPISHTSFAECEAARGKKGSPWPCGTDVHFVAWGKGVVPGSTMSAYQHGPTDLAPTLLALAGGRSVNNFGKSFANCITGTGGMSASNCWGRDVYTNWNYWPAGSSSGTYRLMPNPLTDASGMWTKAKPVSQGQAADGKWYYLLRKYDPATGPPWDFYEMLLEKDPASVNGRYLEAVASPIAETLSPSGGAIDLTTDTDWTVARTQAQVDFIVNARAQVDHERARFGLPVTTNGGF